MEAYPDVPINIEIKGASDADVESFHRNAEALAAYLNELGRTEGIIVASFNDDALARFHQLAPQIDLAPGDRGRRRVQARRGRRRPRGRARSRCRSSSAGSRSTDEAFVSAPTPTATASTSGRSTTRPRCAELLDWGTDGIMTAEPIRLERVLCRRDVARPPRPASAPGEHCKRDASIACDAEPSRAKLAGRRLKVTVRRGDGFAGKCAGEVRVKRGGKKAKARFGFGDLPPAEGGPAKDVVRVKLAGRLTRRDRVRRQGEGERTALPRVRREAQAPGRLTR